MAISELQWSLIALGVAGVGGVFAYNKWQERKHRAHAERVFRQDHPDVLIDQGAERREPLVESDSTGETEGRIEPVIGDMPPAEPAIAQESAAEAGHAGLPDIDPRIDCLVRFEAAEPVTGNDFWSAQRHAFELIDKPVRWFALDGSQGGWRVLDAHAAGRFQQFCCTLQIADRRGPLSGGEMVSFFEGLQQLGDKFLAVIDYPQRETVLADANQLDAFCAGVDAQIAVHVVASQSPFPGAKLAELAEHAGLQLRGDGQFHAEDGGGHTLFTLGNLEAALFASGEFDGLQTHGVTLTVDVPRVADGVAAFDRMIALGLRLANNLGGELVDDNRSRLAEPALLKIRDTIAQFQQQMAQQGIAAGSPTALRLFA
ncbi:MAG TPA: cell division protein ZipA C-terminal FtsZ-binding domain-containing protein [Rhodocyclaceae bacterium]|nr:cell division protein ZipA C-terminal FtsZ-binding domain-containing protein [Rhodocyclaceae bacterium]HMV53021.1 cell division protein ZipA C-terminal FtsZ-binding domain-containing protein [Rhodocyclaceae bacterium]HMZ83362.1 cell division protein ZipA C-terminal FtsZ-binding domain-containing protein [Rhodocyclaceae bacterium]HNA03924.1 cell division protein ZipA C-terminal FtsZ-binding domain-containing protein [Rhodocyclaceae bacterium]HNB78614.1 cell division protein ZipA C-terminal Ft